MSDPVATTSATPPPHVIQSTLLATDALPFFLTRLKNIPTASNYLEIGSFNGDMAAQLARAFPAKTIYCVDPFREDGNTTHRTHTPAGESIPGLESLFLTATRGLANVVLFRETSKEFYSRVHPSFLRSLRVGAVMVDGHHRFDHVVNDLYLALDLTAGVEGAIVYVDDYHTRDVREAVDHVAAHFAVIIQSSLLVGKGAYAMMLVGKR